MGSSKEEQVLKLIRKEGVLRPRDLDEYGIAREYLICLHEKGLIERTGRGLYVLADTEPTEKQNLVEACKRVPHGVICLLSALQFHELTTQNPFEIWIAVGNRWQPKVDLPLRVVRFTGKALQTGIEEHKIDGGTIRVYSPPKTVADCFKYRNKIGLDVALEALRECWKKRRVTMDEFWDMARACRMTNVIRPYLESLT